MFHNLCAHTVICICTCVLCIYEYVEWSIGKQPISNVRRPGALLTKVFSSETLNLNRRSFGHAVQFELASLPSYFSTSIAKRNLAWPNVPLYSIYLYSSSMCTLELGMDGRV